MPTKNPRVNVTLSPSLDALVARMAGHQRLSKSQVLRELLESAEPALQRAAALMDAASQATAAVKERLGSSLSAAQDQAEANLAHQLAHLDAATADVVTTAQAVRGRRPPRAPAAVPVGARSRKPSDPPSSNRGVKSPRRGVKP